MDSWKAGLRKVNAQRMRESEGENSRESRERERESRETEREREWMETGEGMIPDNS